MHFQLKIGIVFLWTWRPSSVCWLKTCPGSKGFQLGTGDWEMIPLYPLKTIQAGLSLLPLISWFKFVRHRIQEQRISYRDPEAEAVALSSRLDHWWTMRVCMSSYLPAEHNLQRTSAEPDIAGLKVVNLFALQFVPLPVCLFPYFLSFLLTFIYSFCSSCCLMFSYL